MENLDESKSASWVIKCSNSPNKKSNSSIHVHQESPLTTSETLAPGEMQEVEGKNPSVLIIPLNGNGNVMRIPEAFSKGYIDVFRKYD
jgi:hypothetical protein